MDLFSVLHAVWERQGNVGVQEATHGFRHVPLIDMSTLQLVKHLLHAVPFLQEG